MSFFIWLPIVCVGTLIIGGIVFVMEAHRVGKPKWEPLWDRPPKREEVMDEL